MKDQDRSRRYTLLEAPSILGLRPTGVERLPAVLLGHGLAERIGGRVVARVTPDSPYRPERDSETRTLNARGIVSYSRKLADAVGKLLDSGSFPVVLGGDCSIVLGPALALRRRGRYGLLFIDGHADFYQPEVNPNGEAASMDLAFVTGHGPEPLANIEGRGPLIRAADAVAFGFRDADEQAQYGSQPLPPELRGFDLRTVRSQGVAAAARAATDHLTRAELDGFWIHVDADCLNDDVMPAVDYRMQDGFWPQELTTVLRCALASERAMGLEITIYNPSLDTDGRAGRMLADLLVAAFSETEKPDD